MPQEAAADRKSRALLSCARKGTVNDMTGSGRMLVGSISSMGNGAMKIDLYNRDGSYAGSMAVSTSRTRAEKKRQTSSSGQKKFKKLQYNFKRLSNQILRTKTSVNAKQLVTKTKFQIADLRMKLVSGEYDYSEIHSALVHAEKIARVARKRLKHLQQEENIEKTGKSGMTDPEEMRTEEEEENEIIDTTGMSQEEREQLAQALEEELEKIEQELEEALESEEFMEDFFQAGYQDMEPQDLEQLKKKHRSEEMTDIMKADMEYLKALFDRLSKEKAAAGSGSYGSGSSDGQDNSCAGVSLELGGVDIPVEAVAEAPVEAAGTAVDVTV